MSWSARAWAVAPGASGLEGVITDEVSEHPASNSGSAVGTASESTGVVEFGHAPRVRWRPLSQVLIDEGVLTAEAVEEVVARHQRERPDLKLWEMLIAERAAAEAEIMRCLAVQFGRQFIRVRRDDAMPEALNLLPDEFMYERTVLPLHVEDKTLTVATDDPSNVFVLDEVRRRTGLYVRAVVACRSEIKSVLEDLGRSASSAQVEQLIQGLEEEEVEVVEAETEDLPDLEKVAGESPIIRLANYIIADAVRQGASDIHIEPSESRLRIRYRIDGILFETMSPPLTMHAALVSRLKIMATLDISERRLPQDGRIRAMVHGKVIDLRVSVLPTAAGEKCVIRILDNSSLMVGMENLGFGEDNLAIFKNQIAQPHGIILVTGPTGSGKSTTLYSALRELQSDEINISTVEDPVEYRLETINQVQVSDRIGMTFAAALRSLLRQDPDVIMVGEIRDEETARIAVQAALTGHLVLSTLHTNDAPSSITRLINIGIESYLIAASLNCVAAQRLVRRICVHCKEAYEPSQELYEFLESQGLGEMTLHRGKGCPRCRNTGYAGRVAIYEMLVMDDTIRDFVTSNPSVTEMRRLIRERGMVTLREDGFEKVKGGLTTVEEVLRVTEAIH